MKQEVTLGNIMVDCDDGSNDTLQKSPSIMRF